MILQALATYYDRLLDDQDVAISRPGFSREKISFELLLDPDGKLLQINDLREAPPKGKKLLPRLVEVPQPVKRTAGVAANFLWDNSAYVLGADAKGKPERAREQLEAFKKLVHDIGDALDDSGMQAVLRFLDTWNPEQASELEVWEELAGTNLIFRLAGEECYVHQRQAVRQAWLCQWQQCSAENYAMCLVTGRNTPIARLHPSIKGVRGANSSGASLVSFNLDAFTSYNKEQSYNAPVGEAAAFAYTTALNHMLARDSLQQEQLSKTVADARRAAYGDKLPPRKKTLLVGDATTVFWTKERTDAESDLLALFDLSESPEDAEKSAHDTAIIQRLRDVIRAVRDGREVTWGEDTGDTEFYVLGLSPNVARLSVRFWLVSSVGDMAARIGQHFADLEIEKSSPKNPSFPSLWHLLLETAPQRKTDNIPPNLGGELMRAILTGAAYPESLRTRIIGRIRADQQVGYVRAAILKAFLSRKQRNTSTPGRETNREVSVSLDPNNTEIGYLLGRLFAVLEKAQQDALPGLNATIKDRFFAAASATPRSVFPRLIRLAQHHIAKSEYGYVTDRLLAKVAERMDAGTGFPAHLNLDGQSLFALGYYHQRNDNFRANDDKIDPVKERSA